MILTKSFIDGLYYIGRFVYAIFRYFFIGLYVIITLIPRYIIILCSKDKRKKIKNRTKKQKKLSFIIFILSLIIYLISVFFISKWSVQSLRSKYLTKDIISSTEIIEKEEVQISNETTEDNDTNKETKEDETYYPNDYWDYMNISFMDVNLDNLKNKNNDTVGWIKVNGTNVNYPVVQTTNNSYYLEHAFNKANNTDGWIFVDYRNDFTNFDKNTIIYGHNLISKTMFGSLTWLLKDNWFNNEDKKYIKISTPTSNTIWKIFSVYTIPSETYYLKTKFTDDTYNEWLNTISSRSSHYFGESVTINDKVLTLSTCNDAGTGRMVTHAKMVNIEYK